MMISYVDTLKPVQQLNNQWWLATALLDHTTLLDHEQARNWNLYSEYSYLMLKYLPESSSIDRAGF